MESRELKHCCSLRLCCTHTACIYVCTCDARANMSCLLVKFSQCSPVVGGNTLQLTICWCLLYPAVNDSFVIPTMSLSHELGFHHISQSHFVNRNQRKSSGSKEITSYFSSRSGRKHANRDWFMNSIWWHLPLPRWELPVMQAVLWSWCPDLYYFGDFIPLWSLPVREAKQDYCSVKGKHSKMNYIKCYWTRTL